MRVLFFGIRKLAERDEAKTRRCPFIAAAAEHFSRPNRLREGFFTFLGADGPVSIVAKSKFKKN